MIFDYTIGSIDIGEVNQKVNYRYASRGVIFQGNKLLLVRTYLGDYKFPGGGLKKGETDEEALVREIREETGYLVKSVDRKIGRIQEVKIDEYEEQAIFSMISSYYLCNISLKKGTKNLDAYEIIQGFQPFWPKIDEAIQVNEGILANKKDKNSWVLRETMALTALKNLYFPNG